MICNKNHCPWEKMTDDQLINPAEYKVAKAVEDVSLPESPEKLSDVVPEAEENSSEEITEVVNDTEQEEAPASAKEIPAEEPEEETTGQRAYIHISPSQKEMFEHLSCADREKKKAYLAFGVALLYLFGCFLGFVTAGFFLLASAIHVMAGLKHWKKAKKESTYISDSKRGYLRIEGGWLHCEQGIGTQYEELHIPISKISSTLAYGSNSDRQLALTFSPADAHMTVNGTKVEEGLYELRGGIYDADDWKMFADIFSKVLPGYAKFDENVWDKEKGPSRALLIFADVLALTGVIVSVLLREIFHLPL